VRTSARPAGAEIDQNPSEGPLEAITGRPAVPQGRRPGEEACGGDPGPRGPAPALWVIFRAPGRATGTLGVRSGRPCQPHRHPPPTHRRPTAGSSAGPPRAGCAGFFDAAGPGSVPSDRCDL